LSEQFPPEAAPPEEEEMVEQSTSSTEADEPEERRGRSGWIAPAWFLFGIIVGIVGFAAYNALIVKSPTAALPAESLDPNAAMRAAARDGVLEAIATLQAGGQPAAQEPQGPQVVSNDAFTVRVANRQGDPGATVTIFEFSDFQ
jgi:hypothetical protein